MITDWNSSEHTTFNVNFSMSNFPPALFPRKTAVCQILKQNWNKITESTREFIKRRMKKNFLTDRV